MADAATNPKPKAVCFEHMLNNARKSSTRQVPPVCCPRLSCRPHDAGGSPPVLRMLRSWNIDDPPHCCMCEIRLVHNAYVPRGLYCKSCHSFAICADCALISFPDGELQGGERLDAALQSNLRGAIAFGRVRPWDLQVVAELQESPMSLLKIAVASANVDMVKVIAANLGTTVTYTEAHKLVGLAAGTGSSDIVQTLLATKGVDGAGVAAMALDQIYQEERDDRDTCVMAVVESGFVEAHTKAQAVASIKLEAAVAGGDAEQVINALDAGVADPNYLSKVSFSLAVEKGHVKIIDALLRNSKFNRQQLDRPDHYGHYYSRDATVMSEAQWHGQVDVMLRLLWDTDLNFSPRDCEGDCAMGVFECFDGNAIRELREDIVIRAFRQAVLADRLEDATQLLDTHGDHIDPTIDNNSTLRWAAKCGYRRMVERLLENDKVVQHLYFNDAICGASDNGHFELVKLMQARASSQAFTVLDCLTFKHASSLSAVMRGDIARQVQLLASRLPADQVLEDSVCDVVDPSLHARALSEEERKKFCKTVYDKFYRETTYSPKSQFTVKVLDSLMLVDRDWSEYYRGDNESDNASREVEDKNKVNEESESESESEEESEEEEEDIDGDVGSVARACLAARSKFSWRPARVRVETDGSATKAVISGTLPGLPSPETAPRVYANLNEVLSEMLPMMLMKTKEGDEESDEESDNSRESDNSQESDNSLADRLNKGEVGVVVHVQQHHVAPGAALTTKFTFPSLADSDTPVMSGYFVVGDGDGKEGAELRGGQLEFLCGTEEYDPGFYEPTDDPPLGLKSSAGMAHPYYQFSPERLHACMSARDSVNSRHLEIHIWRGVSVAVQPGTMAVHKGPARMRTLWNPTDTTAVRTTMAFHLVPMVEPTAETLGMVDEGLAQARVHAEPLKRIVSHFAWGKDKVDAVKGTSGASPTSTWPRVDPSVRDACAVVRRAKRSWPAPVVRMRYDFRFPTGCPAEWRVLESFAEGGLLHRERRRRDKNDNNNDGGDGGSTSGSDDSDSKNYHKNDVWRLRESEMDRDMVDGTFAAKKPRVTAWLA
jgi:hypothetical protein